MKHKNYFYFALIISLVIILDQLTKFYFTHRNFPIIRNILEIKYAENPGVIFGVFPHNPFFLFVLPILVIALVVYWFVKQNPTDYKLITPYALIIAGLLGNIIDRAFRGFVIDWLFVMIWLKYNISLFNIADASLVVGVVLFLYLYIQSSTSIPQKKLKRVLLTRVNNEKSS